MPRSIRILHVKCKKNRRNPNEFLLAPMEEAMNANVLPLWKNKVKIVFSQLKESDAAILGASALAWEL